MFLVWKQTYLRGKFNCTISSVILKQGELRRNKTFLLCMYFYITLLCIGYSPSIPLSRHQGPTILYYPPLLGPIPLLRVPSSSYSLLLTASLYDPVSGSNRWNPCTHVHPCQGLWAHGVSRVVPAQRWQSGSNCYRYNNVNVYSQASSPSRRTLRISAVRQNLRLPMPEPDDDDEGKEGEKVPFQSSQGKLGRNSKMSLL